MKKTERHITVLIGKAIREGRYLNITYKNKSGEIKPFWISVLDISQPDELKVNMFNVTKDEPLLNKKIFISAIQSAELLMFSRYEVPEGLIRRLESDPTLQHDLQHYPNDLLNYYLECYKANQDPFLHKAHLIHGLDLIELTKIAGYGINPMPEQNTSTLLRTLLHFTHQQLLFGF